MQFLLQDIVSTLIRKHTKQIFVCACSYKEGLFIWKTLSLVYLLSSTDINCKSSSLIDESHVIVIRKPCQVNSGWRIEEVTNSKLTPGTQLNITHEDEEEDLFKKKLDNHLLQLVADILQIKLSRVSGPGWGGHPRLLIRQGLAQLGGSSQLVVPEATAANLTAFTIPVNHFRPSLYYKLTSVRGARNVYILPFAFDLWLGLIAALFALTAAMTISLSLEATLPIRPNQVTHTIEDAENSASSKELSWEFTEVTLVTISALCQQGVDRDPVTAASRTMFLTLFVTTVLTFTAYSASVISYMSSSGPVTSTLNGLLQAARTGTLPLALQDVHYFRQQFHIERNMVSRSLKTLEVSPAYLSISEGMDAVIKGELAFCADAAEASRYLSRGKLNLGSRCTLGIIPLSEKGPGLGYAFPVQTSSNIRRQINYALLKAKELGLSGRLINYLSGGTSDADACASVIHLESVALADIWPALELLFFGFALAIVFFFGELIYYHSMKYIKKKVNKKTVLNIPK